MRELSKLYEIDHAVYLEAVKCCALHNGYELPNLAEKNPANAVIQFLSSTFATFQEIRKLLREMSSLSDVPIEPLIQTRLLDACIEVPGVITAGVPGAGGFDAIFCIVISDEAVKGVEQVWSSWREMCVTPLLTRASSQGFMMEDIKKIKGLNVILDATINKQFLD